MSPSDNAEWMCRCDYAFREVQSEASIRLIDEVSDRLASAGVEGAEAGHLRSVDDSDGIVVSCVVRGDRPGAASDIFVAAVDRIFDGLGFEVSGPISINIESLATVASVTGRGADVKQDGVST